MTNGCAYAICITKFTILTTSQWLNILRAMLLRTELIAFRYKELLQINDKGNNGILNIRKDIQPNSY